MLPFHKVVENDFNAVNEMIIEKLHSNVGLVENIGHYIIDAGGKRLRPLLVLLSARSCGYQGRQHIDLATIIEFIHTATLLHDDVVDTSSLRRGHATVNAKWGNAPSVLVGDFLYSRSFQMMVAIDNAGIMRILADTTNIISEGEVQQLINRGDPDTSEETYYDVIRKKTAQLFEAASHTGAVLAQADSDQRGALKKYGHHLGMSFQLIDDALDYQGNAGEMGKNVGDDLAEGKPTLPLIYAMKQGGRTAQLIYGAIKSESGELKNLDQIIDAVKRSGAIDYVREVALQHAATAKSCLGCIADSREKKALSELADFSITRSY